ncbi:hypothetical protein ACFE04_004574 [Oxalis oulophora]
MQWVLSSKEINFPYPLALTLLHMVFSSVLCFAITKVFKIMKVEQGTTPEIFASSVIPIGAMFAMTLWLGNTAYLYISVSLAQMLKAITAYNNHKLKKEASQKDSNDLPNAEVVKLIDNPSTSDR